MRYLRSYNESKSQNNEMFYTLFDILQEYFDDNGIKLLPNMDKVIESGHEDYEDYLGVHNNMAHKMCGYFIETPTGRFEASNKETDEKIQSVGMWNIDLESYNNLIKYIDENKERIYDATGFYPDIEINNIDENNSDVYVSLITSKDYKTKFDKQKLESYTARLKKYAKSGTLKGLSDEKREEAFRLLDELFRIIE